MCHNKQHILYIAMNETTKFTLQMCHEPWLWPTDCHRRKTSVGNLVLTLENLKPRVKVGYVYPWSMVPKINEPVLTLDRRFQKFVKGWYIFYSSCHHGQSFQTYLTPYIPVQLLLFFSCLSVVCSCWPWKPLCLFMRCFSMHIYACVFPSPCTTCFMVPVMGLGLGLLDFSS